MLIFEAFKFKALICESLGIRAILIQFAHIHQSNNMASYLSSSLRHILKQVTKTLKLYPKCDKRLIWFLLCINILSEHINIKYTWPQISKAPQRAICFHILAI